MNDLTAKTCVPCEGGVPALAQTQIDKHLSELGSGWNHDNASNEIQCTFKFKTYYQTIAFVNAIAWMAHHENHHPDLEVSYNTCKVRYSTHAIGGLSENDFICAAKVDTIFKHK